MTPFPDFRQFGYEVTECLNNNATGGRITYKALDLNSQQAVVIKQFCFAKTSNWDEYKAIEREIEVLRGLKHPGIPKFLTKFDPGDGLCFVQEYKNADPLSKPRTFSPEEIKDIANQILEILIYLQNQIPIIIHRDLKPDNILVDDDIKVYLIDFGLAIIGQNTMRYSEMFGGTLGFMPPEQQRNLKLTEASDLYALGATLICLITKTKSSDVGNLVNSMNQFIFKDRVPKFSFKFIQWLEKMVEPEPVDRFPDAKTALEALQPLYIIRIPDVTFDKSELKFIANKVGEKLSQTIKLKNTVSETILQGQWYVAPHPNDPPHTPDDHVWIRITPKQFEAHYEENVTCTITIDTSKLKADKIYQREIVLESNAKEERIRFKVSIQTAKINFDVPFPVYSHLIFTILLSGGLTISMLFFYKWIITNLALKTFLWGIFYWSFIGFWATIGSGLLVVAYFFFRENIMKQIDYYNRNRHPVVDGVEFSLLASIVLGIIYYSIFSSSIPFPVINSLNFWAWISSFTLWSFSGICMIFGVVIGISFAWGMYEIIENINHSSSGGIAIAKNWTRKNHKTEWFISLYVWVCAILGISTGIGVFIGFKTYLLTASVLSAVLLTGLSIYPPLRLKYLKSQYRQQESQKLIEP